MKLDLKKSKETLSNVLQKTTDTSKKVVTSVKDGAQTLSEKVKQDNYERRLKKYNPIFIDKYKSSDFNIPNMIMVVDDALRRDVDVCKGAIGWLGNEEDIEVLYLYDEIISSSGIQFIPNATCDSVYYVDAFDRNRFIRLDLIFSKAHEEKLAELKHIAHVLGAKKCIIEINESINESVVSGKSWSSEMKGKIKKVEVKSGNEAQIDTSVKNTNQRNGRIVAEFNGSDSPKRPKLKWFAQDENIKKLIEMRLKNSNAIKSETIEIMGATCSAMSQKTAYKIDNALSKMKFKVHSSMHSQAVKESKMSLIYSIEF